MDSGGADGIRGDGRADRRVHRQIKDLAADYEHVVIDTPPGDMAVTCSAILSVPLALVPLTPTGLDIDRLRPTWDA